MKHYLIIVIYDFMIFVFKTFYFFPLLLFFNNNFNIFLYYYILKLFDRKQKVNNSIKGKSSNF